MSAFRMRPSGPVPLMFDRGTYTMLNKIDWNNNAEKKNNLEF